MTLTTEMPTAEEERTVSTPGVLLMVLFMGRVTRDLTSFASKVRKDIQRHLSHDTKSPQGNQDGCDNYQLPLGNQPLNNRVKHFQTRNRKGCLTAMSLQ